MKTLSTLTAVAVAFLGVTACNSKDGSRLKEAGEGKADTLNLRDTRFWKNLKLAEVDSAKQAVFDVEARKEPARAPMEVKLSASDPSAEDVSKSGEEAAQIFADRAKETSAR